MSKKKKQNLQKLIAKKQQLQRVAQGSVVSFSDTAKIEPYQKIESAIFENETYQPKATRDRALKKTAISILVIVFLLIAAVIFDNRSPYLDRFGDWIYSVLRLQG